MNHNYLLERKTVTAFFGILALSLGILGDVSAAEPVSNENKALGDKIVALAKPQTFKLTGGVKLVVKKFEVTQVGKLAIEVKLKARLKKKNPKVVAMTGNKYTSTKGVIKVRFSVATKGGQLCTPSVSITGVNFHNVQNDLEQLVKKEVNEYLLTLLPKLCVPI